MDESDEWRDSDRARRRRSDVQGKLYNFLNRSAQSLSRSNSQSGRSHRVKDRELQASIDRDAPRASHAVPSRLPLYTSNAPETSQGKHYSSARTSRSATGPAASIASQPRKSSSPPLTPLPQHKHTVSSTPQSKTSTIAYSYNTPPQTPSSSRNFSNPSSPTSPIAGKGVSGVDLFINRPLARPITPSKSSTSRKVFGIPLPSPNSRKVVLGSEETSNQQTYKLRSGSGSSNEPLLHSRSPTSESEHIVPRPSTSTPRSASRTNPLSEEGTPLLPPLLSLPRSHRSAANREEPPVSPATSSRRGTPKLDFWRSITPRAPSAQGEREKDKGKQRAATPDANRKEGQMGQPGLVSPQPRAPATFLPSIPQLQRTPPTPRKGEQSDTRASPRVDSFMSDSMPLPQSILKTLRGEDPSVVARHPAFTQQDPLCTSRTPAPQHKPAPALGIQRSASAPGTNTGRGRLSPCLRIPSPKFLNRERSREREKEKEMHHEKRRVTPESVGAPILREPRAQVHAHGHTGEKGGLKAPKTSMMQLRRAAHGTFDFERPGSRTSSKSGQSDSHGTRSDDEKEKEKEKENEMDGRRVPVTRPPRISEPVRSKVKATSPVPPLPTPRLKPRSPPPIRTRSPLAVSPPALHSHLHADDSTLPRLSSSLARRNSSSNQQHSRTHAHGHRTPASLPHFSFEPAAAAPPSATKPARDVGGQYIDTRTGLIMWAPTIPEDTPRRSEGGRRGTSSNGHAAIEPRALEEATAVITQFKNALDEAGFATLQKYVRRYDAQIIPLEGTAGLLTRVQRLLETSAPRVDERRKRQLFDRFTRVVSQVS